MRRRHPDPQAGMQDVPVPGPAGPTSGPAPTTTEMLFGNTLTGEWTSDRQKYLFGEPEEILLRLPEAHYQGGRTDPAEGGVPFRAIRPRNTEQTLNDPPQRVYSSPTGRLFGRKRMPGE